LLLSFALGSGKTHAALGLVDATQTAHVNVVAAVSLLPQWVDSVKQHSAGSPVTDFILRGYQRYARDLAEDPDLLVNSTVLVDEAHYYKNITPAMEPAVEGLEKAQHVMALTGTPVRNDVRDIDLFLRLLGKKELIAPLQDDERGLKWSSYLDSAPPPPNPYQAPATQKKLLQGLRGLVAQYNPAYCEPKRKYQERYPLTVEKTVSHHLTWPQALELALFGQGMYTKINNRRVCTGRRGGVLRRLSIMNAVVDQATGEVYSSKADHLVASIQESNQFPQVAFSKFKANMLAPVAGRIRRALGPTKRVVLLTGDTPVADRPGILRDYNAGLIHVLLVCRVGGEGIDLTGPTKVIHLLEPQNNRAEEQQIIGRVVRYSKKKRKPGRKPDVTVIRYTCGPPEGQPHGEHREYLLDLVNSDDRLIRAFVGDAEQVPLDAITAYIKQTIGATTEEQRIVSANERKYQRTQPLDTLLWMAGFESDKKVPKYWRKQWQQQNLP
jgi:hypothetical protein